MSSKERILIVGIGSSHGDDQAGWLVIEEFSDLMSEKHVELRVAKSPADILDWLGGNADQIERLVVCDASHGAGRIGEIRRWNWPSADFSAFTMASTHNLSLPNVLALAEQLGFLPKHISIWTIEGSARQSTNPLSPEVVQAIPQLIHRIACEENLVLTRQELPCTNNR